MGRSIWRSRGCSLAGLDKDIFSFGTGQGVGRVSFDERAVCRLKFVWQMIGEFEGVVEDLSEEGELFGRDIWFTVARLFILMRFFITF